METVQGLIDKLTYSIENGETTAEAEIFFLSENIERIEEETIIQHREYKGVKTIVHKRYSSNINKCIIRTFIQ